MNEKKAKYQRKIMKKYINILLSNMGFWDRVRFVFTGNYYKPLMRTENKIR